MKTSVDLYPVEYYAYVSVRRRLTAWACVFVVVVAAVTAVSLVVWGQVRTAETQLAALELQVQEMELWGARLAPLIGDLETARERQRVLAQLVQEPEWSAFLNDLAHAAGSQVWLSQFSVEAQALQTEDGTPAVERTVSIHGFAQTTDDFIAFMAALSGSPRVSNIDQEYSRKATEFEDGDVREFQISALML